MRELLAYTGILFILALAGYPARAQILVPPEKPGDKPQYLVQARIIDGETIPHITLKPVYIFPKKADMRRYERLIRNIKITYPIAKHANQKLREIEDTIKTMPTKREQERYIKHVEKEMKAEYTPILKKMTFSQGKILIKLIDRETGSTSYQLVKELRGGFNAFLWQGVAKLFGANLKDSYDKDGDDMLIEQLIEMYEAGML